jgi:hypothetical protein
VLETYKSAKNFVHPPLCRSTMVYLEFTFNHAGLRVVFSTYADRQL